MGRRKRFAASVGVIALVAVLVLCVWEWRRRAVAAADAGFVLEPPTTVIAGADDFSAPEAFESLRQRVSVQYLEMDDRYRRLRHRRKQISQEFDGGDRLLTAESSVEEVDFAGDEERRMLVSRTDPATGKPLSGATKLEENTKAGRTKFIYPFTRQAGPGDYFFRPVGVELLDGRKVVKIAFEPRPPLERKLIGFIWADPQSGEPIQFLGRWRSPPFPIDRFEMQFRYGLVETGRRQIRRVVTDGVGGFAFFLRRYHVVIDFDDYREPALR